MDEQKLLEDAQEVLKQNDRGKWTVPAGDLYPHQWLWDSCFIAMGLRHLDVERSQTELRSLLRGQWSNGMLPHMIFNSYADDRRNRERERSFISPYSPPNVATSGITQPPMLAEAVVQVGKKLKMPDRRSWYREMYSPLLRHHEWLYADRDPHKEGLAILIHPYECGLDNTPVWISELRKHSIPMWVNIVEKLHLEGVATIVRRDTRHVSPGQRMSNAEAMAYWAALRRLRRKAYNSEAILSRSLFAVQDLAFNCIFIRANKHLEAIAKDIGHTLPESLSEKMRKTEKALEELWDEKSGQYYSRSFVSHKLVEEPTIMTFLPLYAGSITKDRAAHLAKLVKSGSFWLKYPLPSVPKNSEYFNPLKYWQGPTWVNTNWLVIDGLKRYGFDAEAELLRKKTLEMVNKGGMYEYFSPLDASSGGASNFSWTAALIIDLLRN